MTVQVARPGKGVQGIVALLAFLGVALLPALGVAAELEVGTEVEISAIQDFLATVWSLINGPAGKVLGVGLIWAGLTRTGNETARGNPWIKAGSGVGVAFAPPIITSSFESAPAASVLVPGQSLFAQILDGFSANRLVYDPVFLVVLLGVAVAIYVERRRRAVLVQ
jgi:hypothetical protein